MKMRHFVALSTGTALCSVLVACGGGSDSTTASTSTSTSTSQASTPVTQSTTAPTPTPAPASAAAASLSWSVDAGQSPVAAQINMGTSIGKGAGSTPFTLAELAQDAGNTEVINSALNPFQSTGTVTHPAAGLCDYTGATPKRISYATGATFSGPTDPLVKMAPFYFPLVYTSNLTTTPNAVSGSTNKPIIGLFDWRPKDIDESLVVAESDDNGKTWYFMQNVLDMRPSDSICPSAVTATNANTASTYSATATADDGWGHASLLQLPGTAATSGQMLYMLNRDPAVVDVGPLNVIALPMASNKFPIWNTNNTNPGGQDILSIASALTPTAGATNPIVVKQTVGLLNPDGILAVVPNTNPAKPTTVIYVQKILNGDNTGSTAMPTANQCTAAPFSGKSNHDISNVRLATTTDGINFTDQGVVSGLNDPTTVDYNGTRWISPRGTLIDINGDGSKWGLFFAGGNCLDGDSDAFHYIGYAESTDLKNWTVFNNINNPIASINTITTKNQGGNQSTVTIPAKTPLIPTQSWFAQRLYAPSAVQIDATHISMTFAGYGVQSPNKDLLNYRQIGNVVLTASKSLPKAPNNINNQ